MDHGHLLGWMAIAVIAIGCGGEQHRAPPPTPRTVAPSPSTEIARAADAGGSIAIPAVAAPADAGAIAPSGEVAVDADAGSALAGDGGLTTVVVPGPARFGNDDAHLRAQLVPWARRCYKKFLGDLPDGGVVPEGRLVVNIAVGVRGQVTAITTTGPAALKGIAACIEKHGMDTKFDGGEARKLSLPINFVGKP